MQKEPPKYSLVLGFNVRRRWECGAMIYYNGRLIRLYDRPQGLTERSLFAA